VEEHHKYIKAKSHQKLSEATRNSRRGRDKFSLKLPEGLISPASTFTLRAVVGFMAATEATRWLYFAL
jgi:hypothetical protein